MLLSDFDFDLPASSIALRPASPRDAAKMLLVGAGEGFGDLRVSDLPEQLRAGDLLVLNNTRVIAARLTGVRARETTTVAVEATLHRRLGPSIWSAFMRPGKRLAVGDVVVFGAGGLLRAEITGRGEGGERTLTFDCSGTDLDEVIATCGEMPLPPYIAAKRRQDGRDRIDYQTVYSQTDGSVAAPTAGLHFTRDLMTAITARGVEICFVTLHVGAGTFLPVKTDDVEAHKMHAEYGEVSTQVAEAINATRAKGGRIICVGTTSLRLVESAANEAGIVVPFAAETAIFIRPGYRFRVADGLMTNFHLPKSTLFMLVSAFAGTARMRAAYAHAVSHNYRFYSYGDSSLLWRAGA